MKKLGLVLMLAFIPSSAKAYVNLTGGWAGNGQAKLAEENLYPFGGYSTATITRNWDGTTIKVFGLKNESIGWMLWLLNSSGVNATSVRVELAPFVGPSGSVISSTGVLCAGTTSFINRPFQLFVSTYVNIIGMTELSWVSPPYEERDVPRMFRNSFTVNGNGQGVATAPSVWSNRPDADKFYPDALIPHECFATFSVNAGRSRGVWSDLFIDKNATAGTYTSSMKVYEGATVSTTIPVQLIVKPGTMPDKPSFTVVGYMNKDDVSYRMNGIAHGTLCLTAACKATRGNFYRLLHHEGITPVGDIPDANTNNFPSTEYQQQLDGTMFSAANGYYGRGIGTKVPIYSIGTYASISNNPNYSSTNITNFSTVVSSWQAYFAALPTPTSSYFYWSDENPDLTNTEKWSTWIATVPAAQVSGYRSLSFATGNWTDVAAAAPHLNMPCTTAFVDNNYAATDWQNIKDSYTVTGSSMVCAYNGHPGWAGTMYATEDDGISAMEPIIADWMKGVNLHFIWHTNNWYNAGNQNPAENCLWGPGCAKTFGLDAFPSTDTARGHFGYRHSNGDGVLSYPGTEVSTYTAASFGIDGPIPSLRLKYVRNGINFVDYLTRAYAVNPSATLTIINALIPLPLWDKGCFSAGADCSFQYGGRLWSEDPNAWETARESLADMIPSDAPVLGYKTQIKGSVIIKGSVQFK